MSLTNGKHILTPDPNCPHWTQQGTWRLYGITQLGNVTAMPTSLVHGMARDANKFAAKIAQHRNYKGWFLVEVKGETL